MVSSTDIPKAMLNTRIVEGFIGIPKYPIKPAVINNGNIFGIKEIIIILNERNKNAINTPINNIAKERDITKLLIKKFIFTF